MKAKRKIKTESGENVFEALGFSPEESAVLTMRVYLASVIETYAKKHRMNQTRAAEFFGATQGQISKILRRKFDEISLDKLVRMAARTGRTPTLSMRKPQREGALRLNT